MNSIVPQFLLKPYSGPMRSQGPALTGRRIDALDLANRTDVRSVGDRERRATTGPRPEGN
jgi:hypothetical protein